MFKNKKKLDRVDRVEEINKLDNALYEQFKAGIITEFDYFNVLIIRMTKFTGQIIKEAGLDKGNENVKQALKEQGI